MKRIWILLIVFLSVINLALIPVYALKEHGQEAKPVAYKGIIFKPHFYQDAGVIEAFNAKTGTKIWETKVFDVKLDPTMELDNQWTFIASLKITDAEELLVTDENGKSYRVYIPKEILINDSSASR